MTPAPTGGAARQPDRRHGLRRRATVLSMLAALAAGSCSFGHGLPPIPDAPTNVYLLGPNDQIRIITFGEDALSEVFRVSDAGTIALPLLGIVKASGLTTEQLSSEIAEMLKQKALLRSPSVSIEVTEYRPVFVLGEVTRPGQYPYQPGMTVLSAVAIAGGFTYRAVEDRAAITRKVDGRPLQGSGMPETKVRPGDIITVPQRYF